ncbi:MAG: hypothetical protein E7458_05540 [Ruminococcaceae bacterium]|nr:hypothetical protein [Oscillospiraceae bacterium]
MKRAYRILEQVTPIDGDCGTLCGARCCKGDEHDGMWLLPGEDALLKDAEFLTIRTALEGKYAICTGSCRRELRPLSCRIYPYFPMPEEGRDGELRIVPTPDLRALSTCALFRDSAPPVTPRFRHALRRVGRLLLRDPALRRWLISSGDYIRDVAAMRELLENAKDE